MICTYKVYTTISRYIRKLSQQVHINIQGWSYILFFNKVELKLLKDLDMVLMAKRDIKDGMCHAIYQHAKDKNN